jgi:site-specific DNA recombinase
LSYNRDKALFGRFTVSEFKEYAVYLRKSREDAELEKTAKFETLARHETILKELAERHKIHVREVYKEVLSGDSIAGRPEMQRLLADVESGTWAGVLVMEIERLARGDTIDQGIVASVFKESNTKIITPSKIYDPRDEFDEEFLEFGLFMSRREYKTINRRLQRGRIQSVKEGKYISSQAPYGYKKVKITDGKGYTLEIVESEANVVKMIFKLYLEGLGDKSIANELNRLGVKPRRTKEWKRESISDIIKNPVYIGKVRWGYKKEVKTVKDGQLKKSRTRNSGDYLLKDGLHIAIISEVDFNSVLKTRKENYNEPVKEGHKLQNPLAGLVICQKCGATMQRIGVNRKSSYSTLHCKNTRCDNISAPVERVELRLIDSLREWLKTYEAEITLNPESDNNKQKADIIDVSIKSLEREINTLNKQISNTYDLLEQEVYTLEKFSERNRELSERKINAETKLDDILKQKNEIMDKTEIFEKRLPEMKNLLDKYFNMKSMDDRNRILKLLIERVEYLKEEPNRRGQPFNDNFILTIYPVLPSKPQIYAMK